MRSFWLLLGIVFGLGLIMTAPAAHAVEEPQWSLVYEDGPFTIRDYAPTVVAETRVSGDRGAAINQGFRRLARFIFGANEPSREIAMTAPVAQRAAGERIARPSTRSRAVCPTRV